MPLAISYQHKTQSKKVHVSSYQGKNKNQEERPIENTPIPNSIATAYTGAELLNKNSMLINEESKKLNDIIIINTNELRKNIDYLYNRIPPQEQLNIILEFISDFAERNTSELRTIFTRKIYAILSHEHNIQPIVPEIKSNHKIDQSSTKAGLQRVEYLRNKYTPEEISEKRILRAEVEEILNEVEKVKAGDKDAMEATLTGYGIRKFRGKVKDGNPIEFLKANNTYSRFLKEGILFKSDIRKIDNELLKSINYLLSISLSEHSPETKNSESTTETSIQPTTDPLPTDSHQTELIAAGILGNEVEQKIAIANIQSRDVNKKRLSLYKQK